MVGKKLTCAQINIVKRSRLTEINLVVWPEFREITVNRGRLIFLTGRIELSEVFGFFRIQLRIKRGHTVLMCAQLYELNK